MKANRIVQSISNSVVSGVKKVDFSSLYSNRTFGRNVSSQLKSSINTCLTIRENSASMMNWLLNTQQHAVNEIN